MTTATPAKKKVLFTTRVKSPPEFLGIVVSGAEMDWIIGGGHVLRVEGRIK